MTTIPQPPPPPPDSGAESRQRLALDELVVSLSANLSRAEDPDASVNQALHTLVQLIGPDRAFVFRFGAAGDDLRVTHECVMPGARSAAGDLRDAPGLSLEWAPERLREGLVVEGPALDALPEAAQAVRAVGRTLDVRSALIVPLTWHGHTIGGLGLEWMGREGSWSTAVVSTLEVAGRMIAAVLVQAGTDRELRVAEERLRSFIDSTHEAVFCVELQPRESSSGPTLDQLLDATVVECNDAYAHLFGASGPRAVQGRRLAELGPAAADLIRPLCARMGESLRPGEAIELKHVSPKGDTQVLQAQVRTTLGGADRVQRVWGVYRDVTVQKAAEHDRDKLESQLRQAQKMESIGLLAGGIAHDFNNLLVVIANYAQFALDEVPVNPAAAATGLKQVLKACDRAADLTRGLLTFGRRQAIQRRPVELNELVRGLLGVLRGLIPEPAELDFLPGHELGVINGDSGQLEQMLVNLSVNASEAVSGAGRVTIETENVKLNGAYVKAHPWARPGRFVLLTVTDTGAGMPAEVRERIFEPFFTTKTNTKGTGLGLAIVYGIVKQHEGMVHVYSEVGTGTTFKVYLPIVERQASSVGEKVESAPRGGPETILVAEDHDMIRELVRAMLDRAGYRVLLARDGGEARQLFDQHVDEIELVLLDAVLPVVPGQLVYEHIAQRRPELPVLVSSGYASGVFPPHFFADKGIDLVPKPYDTDELLRRIRRALDKRRPGNPAPPG